MIPIKIAMTERHYNISQPLATTIIQEWGSTCEKQCDVFRAGLWVADFCLRCTSHRKQIGILVRPLDVCFRKQQNYFFKIQAWLNGTHCCVVAIMNDRTRIVEDHT